MVVSSGVKQVIGEDAALGAVLRVVIDDTGVGHLAYATARRTICLEHLTGDCDPVAGPLPAAECGVCSDTRRRLQRHHSRRVT